MIVCPLCHARLTDSPRGLRCPACDIVYSLTAGIPQMVDESWLDEATSHEKAAQDKHFAGLPDKAVFKPAYHSCYRGYEVEVFLQAGWHVSASDLSVQALHGLSKRSATRGYQVPYLQADVLHLPFPADSFDVAVVVEGLHHTPDPVRGFAELVRIARHHVAVIEPYTTGPLNLLAWLGLAHRAEYSQRQPHRLTASSVSQMLSVAGVASGSTRLYLDLPPGLLADIVGDRPIPAALMGVSNRAAEWLLRIVGVGNKIALVAREQDSSGRRRGLK